jgi:hypothetical protein
LYTAVCNDLAKLFAKPPLDGTMLAVDETGVGPQCNGAEMRAADHEARPRPPVRRVELIRARGRSRSLGYANELHQRAAACWPAIRTDVLVSVDRRKLNCFPAGQAHEDTGCWCRGFVRMFGAHHDTSCLSDSDGNERCESRPVKTLSEWVVLGEATRAGHRELCNRRAAHS